MQDDTTTTETTASNETPLEVKQIPIHQISDAPLTMFQKVQRMTAWVLIASAVFFLIIGMLAIWGVFGDNGDIVWRSLGSLAVIALAASIIYVGARMAEDRS